MPRAASRLDCRSLSERIGLPIDVRLTDADTRDLRRAARELARGGVGYYAKSDFVHLDTALVVTWKRLFR